MRTSDKNLDTYDVTLFERETPNFWMVTASFDASDRLSICSGGIDDEWYIIVEKGQLGALKRVLDKAAKPRAKTGDENADILKNLKTLFGDQDSNPFEQIKIFLDNRGINWKPDHWASMD